MKTTIEKIAARVASAIALFAISATRQVQASDWTDSTDSTITYTALKTIKGDGSAYVITDIVPTLTDVVKMRFKTRNATLNANETLFCARQGYKSKSFGAMIANSGTGKLRIDRGDQTEQYSSSALAKNTEYLMSVNYGDGSKNTTVTLNGSAFALAANLGATSDNPTSGLVLFALNNNATSILSGYGGQHYLYYFELYDSSGNLKNCLMPAQRDSDSVVGLYDTKSGKFYPQAGGTFTTAARTVTGQGAKWIGRGGDNKMSTAANWEGGVAPQEGDEIDFTLAPPLATIVADIDATFGKVWIGDGDMPGFTGSLTASAVNLLSEMKSYDTSTASFTFALADDNLVWNGTGTNWGDTGAWTLGGEPSDWNDLFNAIFDTANASATLAANATANSVVFRADATVAAGGGTLTASNIIVSNGVSAVVNASTAGRLVKSGAGTLTLGASRAATTHILEGMFKMVPGATLSTSYQLQLGTENDPSKHVTFDYGGQTYTKEMYYYLVNGSSVTLTNGTFWPNSSGGMHISEATKMPAYLGILDSTISAGQNDFYFGYDTLSGNALPDNPQAILAATNSTFYSGHTFYLGRIGVTEGKTNGWYKADFDNCVVTTRWFIVNNDRPLNNARLDNTIIVNSASENFGEIIARDGDAKWITIGSGGLTLDTREKGINLRANLGGDGAVTKVGSGMLQVYTNQTATGALNVNEGILCPFVNVSVARPVSVASGATLLVYGSEQASLADVAFASGAILNIGSYYYGVTPLAVTGSITFPAENGSVTLKYRDTDGAFPKGVYAIYENSGVTAADGAKFSVATEGSLAYSWSVSGDTLILTVGETSGNFWTVLGDGISMSDGANWLNGAPAAGADIDFTGVAFNRTINADAGVTYGAVTMGSGTITFTNALAATSFSDTSKVAVDANSTVTIDGDLEFSGSVDEYIVNYVAAGGRFVVSGDIKAMPGKTSFVYPCVNHNQFKGTIVAKGLVNNSGSTRVNRFALTRGYADTQVNWAVGEHGISGTDGFWKPNGGTIQSTITAEADFRISAEIAIQGPLTLDTKTHTIEITGDTVRRGICGSGSNSGTVTITGAGRVVADYDVNDLDLTAVQKANAFNVNGTATLAVKPGSNLGTGVITVANGAKFEVADSGTLALGGNFDLKAGAKLKFKLDGNNETTIEIASGKTFAATATVAIEFAEDSVFAPGKTYTLVSGGALSDGDEAKFSLPEGDKGELDVDASGNLVYTVPNYFYIKIAEGSSGDLKVPLAWIYENTAATGASSAADISGALVENGANGIPVWQSYCLGLDPNDATSVVVCVPAAGQPAEAGAFKFTTNVAIPAGLTGVAVTVSLDRKSSGGWTEQATSAMSYNTPVALTANADPGNALSFFA